MEHFFTTIPGIITGIGAVLAVIVLGVLYVAGIWKKTKNGEDDRLITILQTTVDELEKKVNQQSTDIEELTKEVKELKRDNEKYIEIFKGRDKTTQDFYTQAFESMKLARDTHDAVTTLVKNMEVTNSNATRLIELLGRHLEVLSKHADEK